MDGWKTIGSSWNGLFSGAILVLGIGHFALPEGPKHDSAGAENGCQGDFVTKVQSAEKPFVLPYPLKFKIDTQNIWGMCLFL